MLERSFSALACARRLFGFSLIAACSFNFASVVQAAPTCTAKASSTNMAKVGPGAGGTDAAILTCVLKGGQGYVLHSKITSTLANATGKITYKVSGQSKAFEQQREQFIVGQFEQNFESLSFWAPENAKELQIKVAIDKRKAGASGSLEINDVTVSESSAYNIKWNVPPVVVGRQRGQFLFSALDRQGDQDVELVVSRATGDVVARYSFPIDKNSGKKIVFPELKSGYYRVALQSKGNGQKAIVHYKTSLLVLAEDIPQDVRVGVDAALTWYGKSDEHIHTITDSLKKAGVGSLRERLSWASMARRPNSLDGGKYSKVLALEKKKGFSLTATFHDSPSWAWGSGSRCEKSDRCPPRDLDAVAGFGASLSKEFAGLLDAIEFWNEPNAPAFYGESTALYSQTLKAFSAGLEGSTMRLLPGGSAGALGDFYRGVLSNNILPFVDAWNQHYYGPPEKIEVFLKDNINSPQLASLVQGKPMWLTEAGASVRPDSNGSLAAAERAQSINLVKTYMYGLAAGFERVYYFCAPHLLEDDYHIWGLFDESTAPRPALATLGGVSMVLQGRQKPVFFKQAGVAGFRLKAEKANADGFVLWSASEGKTALDYSGKAYDLYGSPIGDGGKLSIDAAPIFIVGSLGGGAEDKSDTARAQSVAAATQATVRPRESKDYLVVESVKTGGDSARYDSRQNSYVSSESNSFEVSGVLHGDNRNADLECVPSKGWILKDGSKRALGKDERFKCIVAIPSELSGQGGELAISLKAADGKTIDKVVLPLRAPLQAGKRERVSSIAATASKCRSIKFRSSGNIQVTGTTGAGECSDGVSIKGVANKAADTWIFAYIPIAGASAIRAVYFDVARVEGFTDPSRSVLVQVVKKSGKVITITPDELKRAGNVARYAAALGEQSADADIEVRIGWGRYWGQPGQRFGFELENIEVSNR